MAWLGVAVLFGLATIGMVRHPHELGFYDLLAWAAFITLWFRWAREK